MSNTAQINVYTLENCPNCEILKKYLDDIGAAYNVLDMSDAKALTELRINGIFAREGPVLQVEKKFLESRDLFANGAVREDIVTPLCKGE
ncbi:MAG: glutaredoxin family protein [Euryarchaeota archaeon]|nr:glutaredoxin family protein [Euryarchaeota archaeon]